MVGGTAWPKRKTVSRGTGDGHKASAVKLTPELASPDVIVAGTEQDEIDGILKLGNEVALDLNAEAKV